jgi:alpha-L-fucosidase
MKMFLAAVLLAAACSPPVGPPAPLQPVPTPAQLAWHKMEMNAFVHFGINTFTDKEWGYGDESPALFQPTDFDAGQWVSTFSEAGFRGVVLTAKHHDGFCLWPSNQTAHSVKSSPWLGGSGDVVRAVREACTKHGLQLGIYLSPWDRNHAMYGKPEYITYYRAQLGEIFQDYGPLFEMWFDGANGGDGFYGGARERRSIDGRTYYDWPGTISQVRELEPNIIFFSDAGPGVRWVGNERGVAGETNWCTITPDSLYAGKSGLEKILNEGSEAGTHWIPAETDVSIRPGWFYHAREDSLVKTPEQLFDIYLTSVGRGSTLLLNVPPDRRGQINEHDVASLKGFRKLLDVRFSNDLARQATATAENHRGDDDRFSPGKLNDGIDSTYWATDDGRTAGWIELSWKENQSVNYILMQEYVALGQRVRAFQLEAWMDGAWKTIGSGTTIGYKRIIRVDPVETTRIRLTIKSARACPVLHTLAVY